MAVKKVEEYLEKHSKWQTQLEKLRELLKQTILTECIKWGAPVYTLNNKNVVGLGAFKEHYALWFFIGASLSHNTALLHNAQEGKTKALRQIRFTAKDSLPLNELKKYIEEAIALQEKGIKKPVKTSKKSHSLPEIVKQQFKENPELETHFKALTPGRQREYIEHINSAKQEKTKARRLEKSIPLIMAGKGLHDKYKKK
ncbi:YdeI/OmpD-associated family protein [Haloflavibacter putidus]|uniref:YdhG-like domain-containing protein n=1 Tax=Haloflavibacter putidus TaxID=2576776 RepID=A0A507ZLR3_9FLAO|nr:DUF1801 domain-containing protein [Haloflavibacter putidus]TQD38616.1 hypothetical protein FKR84_08170 [Haloflavibacter putidus]